MSTLPLYSPKFRAFDANGDPLAGGLLYSYAAGTSTPLDTYTTRAGDIANTNPVVLDANGEADVWLATGVLYKLVLADALDVIQWTVDNVPASGSSGSSTTDAAGAVDPGGRLSLASGDAIRTSDVLGASTVFYVPYKHNQVPLYDGSTWVLHSIATELSQALSDATKSPAVAVASSVYDMFIWDDTGTLRLSRGPVWASATVRGGGAGTTEIERVDARFVNRYAISNGPAAQRGLYVGTIRVNASVAVSDGQEFRHVWNAYNRVRRPMLRKDTVESWTYSTDVWRQAANSAANQIDFVIGLEEDPVRADLLAVARHALLTLTGTGSATLRVGIGIDSATVNSASVSTSLESLVVYDVDVEDPRSYLLTASYEGFPGLGRHVLTWLERGVADAGELTWYGQGGALIANSGIIGHLMA